MVRGGKACDPSLSIYLGKRLLGRSKHALSVEDTQRTMEAYGEDLLRGGPSKGHFADEVRVSINSGHRPARPGPGSAERMIDHHLLLHRGRPSTPTLS